MLLGCLHCGSAGRVHCGSAGRVHCGSCWSRSLRFMLVAFIAVLLVAFIEFLLVVFIAVLLGLVFGLMVCGGGGGSAGVHQSVQKVKLIRYKYKSYSAMKSKNGAKK